MNAREWSLRHAELLRAERGALADLLLSLAEFDRVAAYRDLGFATLFDYLHRELRLSRGSAHYRQVATRLVVRFPEIVEPVRDGRLCLTTVTVLARVMNEANRYEVLPRFFGLSRQEAEQVAAEIRPVEVVPRRTVVTGVPVSKPAVAAAAPQNMNEYSRSIVELAPARTLVEPLTRTETRMHVTVSPEFVALLKKAKAGQSHVQPGATDEQVLTAALELLVAQQEKRRASVPPKVKRAVRKRDGGKCTWPLANGGACGSTVRTEIDHVVPRGRGGPSTVENCRVLCDVHNRKAARQVYGDAHMDLFTPRLPRASEPVVEWAGEHRDDTDREVDLLHRVEVARMEGRLRGELPRHRPRRLRGPDFFRAHALPRLRADGIIVRGRHDRRSADSGWDARGSQREPVHPGESAKRAPGNPVASEHCAG